MIFQNHQKIQNLQNEETELTDLEILSDSRLDALVNQYLTQSTESQSNEERTACFNKFKIRLEFLIANGLDINVLDESQGTVFDLVLESKEFDLTLWLF